MFPPVVLAVNTISAQCRDSDESFGVEAMEATVKHELTLFLNYKISAESLGFIDDIVLGYIVSVLEQLGEDEQFDVDEFAEIMTAYIPGFDTVDRDDICSWMLGLAEVLVNARASGIYIQDNSVSLPSTCKGNSSDHEFAVEDHQTDSSLQSLDGHGSCMSSGTTTFSSVHKSRLQDQETSYDKCENKDQGGREDKSYCAGVSVLAEMFPKACSLEIERCLMVANGNTESAVQLMLLKDENGDDEGKENSHGILDLSPKAHCPSAKRQELQKTEQKHLKEQLMARYGYVDVSQEEKTHQPILHKQENKKQVRYRNNQVVSTKGERFSWEKQKESEDMKKTYVNLKPARKYRFH